MRAASLPSGVVARLADQVRAASASRRPLVIQAGGTKDFYGNSTAGERLDPRECAGIVAYEPTELVITARAGTPLTELEAALAERNQMLPFEPPHFGEAATVGGCVAAGLAGPRRAAVGVASGAIRDSVLGARLLDGRGAVLSFGGTVMKNVAGYDVSRLLAGSLGTLGVLLEVSIRVVPQPPLERTVQIVADEDGAARRCAKWRQLGLPVSATLWHRDRLFLRMSGSRTAVEAALSATEGDALEDSEARALWRDVREQRAPFFNGSGKLWRVAVSPGAAALAMTGEQLIEWSGALRWLSTDAAGSMIRSRAAALGGHATLFRGHSGGETAFTPCAPVVARLEARLRAEFDPAGIFNPGRMHANEPG